MAQRLADIADRKKLTKNDVFSTLLGNKRGRKSLQKVEDFRKNKDTKDSTKPAIKLRDRSNDLDEAEKVVDLGKVRDDKNLQKFHTKFMGDLADRMKQARALGQEYHENGKLPFAVGTRFTTQFGRDRKEGPYTVAAHYVDSKHPDRYGYHVTRGNEDDEDFYRGQIMVSDPKAVAIHGKEKWDEIQKGFIPFTPLKSVKEELQEADRLVNYIKNKRRKHKNKKGDVIQNAIRKKDHVVPESLVQKVKNIVLESKGIK